MSELRKANTDLAYFLTFTTVGWIDVFTRKELADFNIEKLKTAQEEHAVAIYTYVILTLAGGDASKGEKQTAVVLVQRETKPGIYVLAKDQPSNRSIFP